MSHPIDDLTLAIQTLNLYSTALSEITEALIGSKVDMRIIKPKTRQTIMVANAKRDEILRRIEIQANEQLQQVLEKH